MVCQPSIRQWVLRVFPSTPKSLGRSCEQLLCGMSVVHKALGVCLGQPFPPQAGRDTGCSCTWVTSCVRITAGSMCSASGLYIQFVLFGAATESLCLHPFFGRYRQNPYSLGSLFRALKCCWISTISSAYDGAYLLFRLSAVGCIKWRKKTTPGMYLAHFSITICT